MGAMGGVMAAGYRVVPVCRSRVGVPGGADAGGSRVDRVAAVYRTLMPVRTAIALRPVAVAVTRSCAEREAEAWWASLRADHGTWPWTGTTRSRSHMPRVGPAVMPITTVAMAGLGLGRRSRECQRHDGRGEDAEGCSESFHSRERHDNLLFLVPKGVSVALFFLGRASVRESHIALAGG